MWNVNVGDALVGLLSIVSVIGIVTRGTQYLRMQPGGIFWVYRLRGYLLGIPVHYVNDPELMLAVLQQSNVKGPFLEQVVAIPAWLPLRSVESTDGTDWKVLRAQFDDHLRRLSLSHLTNLAREAVMDLQQERILDYPTLALNLSTVLLAWISGKERSDVPVTVALQLVTATGLWKRDIALRGMGTDRVIKEELVASIVAYCDFQQKLLPDTLVSDYIQSFLISPMINLTDIFCAIESADDSIKTMVLRSHPFPVLERRLVAPLGPMAVGSQVLIPLAAVARIDPHAWMVFGGGERRCPGRTVASCLLMQYRTLARLSAWCPRVGHRDSGRHNDILSLPETLMSGYRLGGLCLSWIIVYWFG
jgi:hypothetical protein